MFKQTRVQLVTVALTVLTMFVAAACSKKDEKQNPAAAPTATDPAPAAAYSGPTGADQVRAKKIFAERCVQCHGASGHGDGPGAAALSPKPRNYTDPEWQKTITDEVLAAVIVKGGAANGKSLVMPGNPDLDNPDKRGTVDALVQIIRDFGQSAETAPAEPAPATP
jgi:mono/diheme cytochrome c family protein